MLRFQIPVRRARVRKLLSEAEVVALQREVDASPPELASLQSERLTDTICGVIRDRILNGTYHPGQKLPVDKLAQQLGVSQTPVKGAISQLAAEGLMRTSPRRGTFVAEISERAISESLSIRAALEQLAADTLLDHVTGRAVDVLAALVGQIQQTVEVQEHFRLNFRFHQELVSLSGNQKLAEIYRQLNAHIQMALVHSGSASWLARVPEEAAEHMLIVDAIQRRDQVALKRAIDQHLERARVSLLGQLRAQVGAPEPTSSGSEDNMRPSEARR